MPARSTVTVTLGRGLHSRASAAVARVAKLYRSTILLRTADGRFASAKSPLNVFKLKVAERDVLRLVASGPDAEAAISALSHFLGGAHFNAGDASVIGAELTTSDGASFSIGRLRQAHSDERALPAVAFTDAWARTVIAGEPIPLVLGTPIYRRLGAVLLLGYPDAPAFQIIPRDDGLTRLAMHYLSGSFPSVKIAVRQDGEGEWRVRSLAVGNLGRMIDNDATRSADIDDLARNFHARRQLNVAPEHKITFEAERDASVERDEAIQAGRSEALLQPPKPQAESEPKPTRVPQPRRPPFKHPSVEGQQATRELLQARRKRERQESAERARARRISGRQP